MITVKEALMLAGFTSEEADIQLKSGACLMDLNGYIESIEACGADAEEIKGVKEAFNECSETTPSFYGELDLVFDGTDKYILEKCL